VSWGTAADNRSPITSYLVSWQNGSGAPGSQNVGAGTRTLTLPNLTNGVRYTITVAAINAVGRGPAVTANPVTPVAPVSVPGMPPNLAIAAVTAHVDATVTWAAAAPNGAPVTAYRLTWQRDDGSRPGSDTVSGATRSYVITEIWAGAPDVPFTVTVVAVNSAGQGPAATAHKAPPPKQGTVTLSRGPATSMWCGESPSCAWMHVVLSGFPPNTSVDLMPHSTDTNYSNPGSTFRTDGNGSATDNQFAYAGVGQTVYVTATLPDGTDLQSNPLKWTAG
jgi:hypothetical protein